MPVRSCSQDFKPANLMMCNNGLVKVTDYGE